MNYNLRPDRNGLSVLQSIAIFLVIVLSLIVLVTVLSNLWPRFTGALANYSTNETVFGPTVKSLTPILIGVCVLLVILAVVFVNGIFRENEP